MSQSSGIAIPHLKKPLRPFFLHPSTSQPPHIPTSPLCTPVICVSVSRWVGITGHTDDVPSVTRAGGRNVGFEYVPGAGDDDELWAKVILHSGLRTDPHSIVIANQAEVNRA